MPLIEGMEDYHAGKADKISGVKVIDQKTISITYKQPNPSMITGVWTLPLNKKYLGDVPIEKLAGSDKVRKNPIGFGPFKVKKSFQVKQLSLNVMMITGLENLN